MNRCSLVDVLIARKAYALDFIYLCPMRLVFLIVLVTGITGLNAQTIEVEYNKNKDMTGYKTFQFGETEIITPKDKQRMDEGKTRDIVNEALELELKNKGLQKVDSNAHLVLSYIIGSMERSSIFDAGRLGGTPPSVMQDYNEGNLVIDLNDRSNNLIWRVNAVTTFTDANMSSQIEQIIGKGFKKFPNKPKGKKK